tara:strand:- start:20 stop:877 length:858 start_codon:yes stop_codon:yes gene_type:complete
MSKITDLIKELRNKTGAGFLDCKNALEENKNNIDEAVEFLRKKGLAKASKKTSREANEGAIGIYNNENKLAIIKVNSETDFAAKSDTFLNFLDELGKIALSSDNPNLNKDEFLKLKLDKIVVADFINNMIAKIGENLILSDLIILKNDKSYNSFYIHNSYSKNIGKIISLINYESNKNDEKIKSLSKNLCMHVAAMKPESIDISDLDKAIIEKEERIQRELILSSGKPSNIADKILEGKMSKFFSEVTFLNQKFILDQDKTVKEIVNEYQKDYNYNILSFKIVNL